MKKIKMNKRNRRSVGKILTGLLIGSAVGATVGWLTAPASGVEIRRRIMGEALGPQGAWERAKTARGNVESQARALANEANRTANDVRERVTEGRRMATSG